MLWIAIFGVLVIALGFLVRGIDQYWKWHRFCERCRRARSAFTGDPYPDDSIESLLALAESAESESTRARVETESASAGTPCDQEEGVAGPRRVSRSG